MLDLPDIGDSVAVRVVCGVLRQVEPRTAHGRQGARPGGGAVGGLQNGLQRPPLRRHGAVPAEEDHRAGGTVRDGGRHPLRVDVEGQVGEDGRRGRGGTEPAVRRNGRCGLQPSQNKVGPD